MEEWCVGQAAALLGQRGVIVDEGNRKKVVRAVAAAMQRASLALSAAARGEALDGVERPAARSVMPPSATAERLPNTLQAGPTSTTLSGLVQAWWREAERTGKSASTHEAYAHAVRLLVAFLKHDDARRVTKQDIVGFKDHRLASRKRNGELVSATTVKNGDLAALKAVFGWAVDNDHLAENSALGVTVAKVKLREREFTPEEARTLLRAASQLQPGRERP